MYILRWRLMTHRFTTRIYIYIIFITEYRVRNDALSENKNENLS